jgi:hypothetical protein
MTATTTPADEIRQEMQQVRAELRGNVQEIVSSAKEIVDWQNYVRNYPWLTVGAAAFVGYLLVPARSTIIRPDAEAMRELAKSQQLLVKMEQSTKSRTSVVGALVGMLVTTAAQAALAVASHQVQKLLEPAPQPARRDTIGENRHG